MPPSNAKYLFIQSSPDVFPAHDLLMHGSIPIVIISICYVAFFMLARILLAAFDTLEGTETALIPIWWTNDCFRFSNKPSTKVNIALIG